MVNYKESFEEFKKLNEDIFKYRRRRRAMLFLKIAILEIPIILLLVSGLAIDPVKSVVTFGAFAILLPILIFEPYKLYQRPWIGEIIGFKYKERYVFPKGIVIRGQGFRIETFVTFSVKGFDGKNHKFTLPRKYELIYKKGDVVMLVPGIDYPVYYTKRKHVLCMKCGALYIPHINDGYCEAKFCKMALPKIPEKDFDYLSYFNML